MKKKATFLLLLVSFFSLTLLGALAADTDPIRIGIVYPAESIDMDTYFHQGFSMAIDEINAGGGVLGRPIEAIIRDDNNDITTALQIAQTFIDSGVQAVIGHWSSNVCQAVKDTYEDHGIVMITPSATTMTLFDKPYQSIFRMIACNDAYAKAIARHIADTDLANIAIYYSDDVYGMAFANYIELELSKNGVSVADRITNISTANAAKIADRWRAFDCDAIVIASVMPEGAEAIKLIRDAYPGRPIFGGENFDRRHISDLVDGDVRDMYLARYETDSLDSDFVSRFQAKYDSYPGTFAITGYESVYLIKDAILAAGSAESSAIAAQLQSLTNYPSITGELTRDAATQEFTGYRLSVDPVSMK